MAGLVRLVSDSEVRPAQATTAAVSSRGATRMEKSVEAVTVVPYRKEFRAAFERLNREWIETFFDLEPADREVFSDPEAKILASGGEIFFVLEGSQVQGTCAVLRHGREDCEIAKMAVAREARGRGYGDLLMEAAIRFSREVGASRIIIVSNTVLEPAIRLYQKHGFVPVPLSSDGRYRRANIRLELDLRATALAGETPAADE
jgi:GNAT superfamily N-acetyltransferase